MPPGPIEDFLFSEPNIGNKRENSGDKLQSKMILTRQVYHFDENVSNIMRMSEYFMSLARVV